MNSTIRARLSCFAVLLAGSLATPAFVDAQDAAPRRAPAPPPVRTPVGLDVFGGAGFTWPAAEESFDALDLSSTPIDFGGGARVTGLWRGLFAQVAASRWSDSG